MSFQFYGLTHWSVQCPLRLPLGQFSYSVHNNEINLFILYWSILEYRFLFHLTSHAFGTIHFDLSEISPNIFHVSSERLEAEVPVIERSKSSFWESPGTTFIYFFMVYLTTLSVADMETCSADSYVNELERMWKEKSVSYLKILFLKGLRKSMKTVSQDNLWASNLLKMSQKICR